ncbi:penicillin-binding transpeptidase domain-containing protein [Corynebacterium aquatimens]|uniref:Beta-lactamase class D n=1 Tax=Corynebacterium aquatimens TaxID=1190508 RepID=A0A931DZE5_9CORY|nr:penicillin-binding transpeptidase domain-containing protein [Corynebacterium aquatimens]MBG6121864.1 beta-lactamase class D [Corynebacterium aquatimens]WJY65598.1 Stage V sporulation protein D [Corynebacterium aquatimens]
MGTRLAALLSILALAFTATACTPKPKSAEPTAQDFLEALSQFDVDTLASLVDDPTRARESANATIAGMQADGLTTTLKSVTQQENLATAAYTLDWKLPRERHVSFDATMTLTQSNGQWTVRWQPSILHPRLGVNQHLELRAIPAAQASVVSSDGVALLKPGIAYRVLVDKNAIGNATGAANAIAAALEEAHAQDKTVPTVNAQDLAQEISKAEGTYSVAVVPVGAKAIVEKQLGSIAGVRLNEEAAMVNADPTFAPDIMARVGQVVGEDLTGDAGWKIAIVNAEGNEFEDVHRAEPNPSPAIGISLSHRVQIAAEKALEPIDDRKAMIVAIRPSSGEILAIAQTKAADEEGNIATMGQYPPGSTFKIISAGAGIEKQGLTPDSIVPCPRSMDIYGRIVNNYAGFGLGSVPLETAFARSCNTTFADISTQLKPGELQAVGKQFGLGIDYDIPGLDSMTGSIPEGKEPLDRTEAGYGQGLDLASPFGMALVSATAAAGKTPTPYLIKGKETKASEQAPGLSREAIAGLKRMMRAVVTSGTATGMGAAGEIYGKTGEAEINGGSHSWFTGYRDDVAFATLIVLGGGSEAAVAVTDRMFRNIDESLDGPAPQ